MYRCSWNIVVLFSNLIIIQDSSSISEVIELSLGPVNVIGYLVMEHKLRFICIQFQMVHCV